MKFLITLILISLSLSVFPQQNPSGCIIVFPYGAVSAYPNVYRSVLPGVSVPTNENADIQGKTVYDGQGLSVAVNYTCYKNPNPTTRRECAVRAGNASPYKWYGGVFAQDYYQCPLDDYIPLLILPIGLIGFCYIRNRSFYCKNPA
ncbi:hypothetical protein [Pedobacter sp. Leaf132]|uniref:hypothetical protein n=1 Tax=Pedobacter sp. Leaf132 TaxID=2876557 RepID=UPI001E32464F|nr:hypothetical protein [Pedobacter sp. Leaf132]